MSKQSLLTITGGLVILPRDGSPSASDWRKGLDANEMPYKFMSAAEENKRLPQFNVGDNWEAVYTSDTGIVHASKSVTAMYFLARFNGAELRERTRVERVIPTASGVRIITSNS